LEFHFEKLMTHVGELPIVLVRGITQGSTDQTVKRRTSVAFLIVTRVVERDSDEPSHSIE